MDTTVTDYRRIENDQAHRAAELSVILAKAFPAATAFRIASAVTLARMAAKWAKRQAENACNYGQSDASYARSERAHAKRATEVNEALRELADGAAPATIELGGDPRGPCARLHIPGLKGDGWGDGFAVY